MTALAFIFSRKFFHILALLAGVFLGVNRSHAQQNLWPSELWYEGKIVLTDGDTLKGLVKYDMQKDLVQYTMNDRSAEVFTARKVIFFEIFDEANNRYRRFFTLPFETTSGYKTPVFFELLEEGKMTLLSREFLEYKNFSSPYAISYSRLVLSYKFFFLNENGSIEEFSGNKNDLLDRMGRNSGDVEKYMRKNRLKLEDRDDFTRLVDYYNSFFGF